MEFTKEELELIKDVMNSLGQVLPNKDEIAEAIWNKLDCAKVKNTDYEGSIEKAYDELVEGSDSDSCDMTYDCQDMPDDVRSEFFSNSQAGNDCHVTEYVEAGTIVGDYLIEEGFEDGDEVIVKHWW